MTNNPGKYQTVLVNHNVVFAKGDKITEAEEAGADYGESEYAQKSNKVGSTLT